MKTKEELVSVIESIKGLDIALTIDDSNAVIHYLKQPTLNPNKIDEERMATCFEEVFTKDIYAKSNFKTIVDKYNSTCKDHQVLQPLPSDEKTLNKISNIIIRYKDEHIYIEEAEKQIIEEVISPILASHVARILELEEKVKLINGDLDSSLEIINSLRSSCQ